MDGLGMKGLIVATRFLNPVLIISWMNKGYEQERLRRVEAAGVA